jgi:hypothetical protein
MIDARQRRNARTPPFDGSSFQDTNDSGGYLWSSLGGRLSDLLSGNHSTNHHSGHSGGQGDSGGGEMARAAAVPIEILARLEAAL